MKQTCKTCGLEKDILDFYLRKDSGKYRTECKICWNKKITKYQDEHPAEVARYKKQWAEENKEEVSKKQKEHYQENKKEILSSIKIYQGAHKKEKIEYDKQYRKDNSAKLNEYGKQYRKNRRKLDINFKLREHASRSISLFLKSKGCKKNRTSILDYLPYSIQELKKYLESKFEPWMTWENWGLYRVDMWDDNDPTTWTWQIDHIIPHSTFKYSSMEDQEFTKCWALNNLRPYSAKQNVIDGTNKSRHIIPQTG